MSRPPVRLSVRFARGPLVAALFGLVLSTGATTEDASVLEIRRQKIQTLSQPELNRLKRNYENYLKLSREQRDQLTRLDDELEQDAKNGGHLRKLLDQYNTWLFKISPFDRDRLINTADPGERAELVQKILKEQKQRVARAPLLGLLNVRLDGPPPLSTKDLDEIFAAVEENYLRDDAKPRLAQTAPPRLRHVEVMRAVMEQLRSEQKTGTKMRAREAALVETILDAIPKEALRAQITRSGVPAQTRRQLGHVLARSLLAEWQTELDEVSVTPAQIEETGQKWVANAPPERRELVEQRIKTANSRKVIATVLALQTSPHLQKARQPIIWLLRNFSFVGPKRGARAGAGKQAAKAANMPAEGSEKEPAADQPQ